VRLRRRAVRWGLVFALATSSSARSVAAQTVSVTVPAGVTFSVTDASASTAGSPSTQVAFSNPSGFTNAQKLRISVQADASTFSGPGTTRIAATKVSWTATTSKGTASNGTLAGGTYTQVYQSASNLKSTDSGSVSLSWTLAAIAAAGLRSGTHTLTVRWKFEAF
jgi:hypothetical protein